MRSILLAALIAAPLSAQTADRSVDPFIGTGGEGHTFPGATPPFGMVQLSPDTDTSCEIRKCYGHAAGYRYDDPTIQGFSHTHFSGAGHSDLGDILLMPVSGDAVSLDPGDPKVPRSGYRSRFAHAQETASLGYNAVTLADSGVRAELNRRHPDRRASLCLSGGQAGARRARPPQFAVQLSGQDPVVVAAAAPRWLGHRHA